MNIDSTSRPGWVKYVFLTGLAAAGLTGGFYLSGGMDTAAETPPSYQPIHPSPCTTVVAENARFALSAFDAKDSMEAPELTADSAGRVFLAFASQTGAVERTLFLSRSDDAGCSFGTPRQITRTGIVESVSQMKGKTVKRAIRMMPHVVARGESLHLSWTEALPGNTNVRSVVATSADSGHTFGPAISVHQAKDARTTFTAFSVSADDTMVYSWLDNRNGSQQAYASIRRPGRNAFDEETIVHSGDERGVCPCCPTANVMASDGTVYVAFRNIADGYRDIAIGVRKPGTSTFDAPISVVPPAWKFNGCPHDGPSLAIVGDELHVVWMDARTGSPRCYHARARLADMKFTSEELHPIPIGTQGNAKLHVDSTGRLHTVWEESTTAPPAGDAAKHQHESAAPKLGAGGRAIQYAVLGTDGRFGPPRAIAPKAGAFQTRPTIIGTSTGKIVVAWNELDETGKAIVVQFAPDSKVARGGRP